MKIHILLLFSELVPIFIQALHVDDGCNVNTTWENGYKWTTVNIASWIPYENNLAFLTIEIEIEGQRFPTAFDRLDVWKHEIKFTQRRGDLLTENSTEITSLTSGHWGNFILNIDSHHFLMYLNEGNTTLFKGVVHNFPDKLKIRGSNITVNCHLNSKVWNVESEKSVVIPLEDQDVHSFTFFSTKNFLAAVEVAGRQYPFGWHNGSLTMIPTDVEPLPRFEQHLLQLVCYSKSKITCDIKIGENQTIAENNILMSAKPRSLLIMSKGGKFSVIMKGISHEIIPTPTPETMHSPSSLSLAVIVLAISTSILVVVVIILGFYIIRNRNVMSFRLWQLKAKKEEKEESIKRSISSGSLENDYESDVKHKAEVKKLMIERDDFFSSVPTDKLSEKGDKKSKFELEDFVEAI